MKNRGVVTSTLILIIIGAMLAVFVATLLLTSNQGSENNSDLNAITPSPNTTPDLNNQEEKNAFSNFSLWVL